ncbi:hypothetical protein [Candidatus Puniceispirillum sp.]|uniref:hypothetical protein n=1 Tax=Candidatus Puniceispirillum sp. TaxID=2026719 RepID=UPI003F698564
MATAILLFSGYIILCLTGSFVFTAAAASVLCDGSTDNMTLRTELLMHCAHPYPDIRFDDEHPHLDYQRFTLELIEETAPLPEKHAPPPLIPDAHILLVSALYEFGEIEQQGILTPSFSDDDNDLFAWIEEDLYVLEFFKDIYPVQSIDIMPDHAVGLPVTVKVACLCPGDTAPVKWHGTGNLMLDFPDQKGALRSIFLTNDTGSRFDGALDFALPPASDNLFSSKDANIQFQIDGGDTHSWNAAIKGAIDGPRATNSVGHFAASHFDLESGLIGHFKSVDD